MRKSSASGLYGRSAPSLSLLRRALMPVAYSSVRHSADAHRGYSPAGPLAFSRSRLAWRRKLSASTPSENRIAK